MASPHPHNNFSVRTLSASDVQSFKEVRLSALREYPQYFLDNADKASKRSDAEWEDYLVGDNKRVFGLFNNDILIGIASIFKPELEAHKDIAYLAMGFVHPNFRGLGLSSLLYNARLEWAKNNPNINILKISHRKGNTVSSKAIIKNGFKYIDEEQETYGDGTTEISLKYQLNLRDND